MFFDNELSPSYMDNKIKKQKTQIHPEIKLIKDTHMNYTLFDDDRLLIQEDGG